MSFALDTSGDIDANTGRAHTRDSSSGLEWRDNEFPCTIMKRFCIIGTAVSKFLASRRDPQVGPLVAFPLVQIGRVSFDSNSCVMLESTDREY